MKLSWGVVVVLGLGACGDDSGGGGSDAPSGADAPGGADARPDGAPGIDSASTTCAHTAPFTSKAEVMGVNTSTGSEFNARLSHDELRIVYAQGELPGVVNQWTASRTTRDGAFGTPTELFATSTTQYEGSAWLSDDELTVYWDQIAEVTDYGTIWVTTRTSTSVQFARADSTQIPLGTDVYDPAVVPGVGMYFMRYETLGADLFLAAANGTGFDAPVPVAGLNTTAPEDMPTPSVDGLGMYFFGASREPGGEGVDVWVAARAATTDAFAGGSRDLGVLNTAGYEYPSWISDDNCRLYYTALDGSATHRDIWVATRAP